jgi:hypothetical protein
MQAIVAIQTRIGMAHIPYTSSFRIEQFHDGISSTPQGRTWSAARMRARVVDLEPISGAGVVVSIDPCGSLTMEGYMPIILWLLGVPLVVVVALMLTHVI